MNHFLKYFLASAMLFSGLPLNASTAIKGPVGNAYLIEESTTIATSGGTTTLTASSMKSVYIFTGTQSQTVSLPAATTLAKDRAPEFFNQSTGLVTIKDGAGNVLRNLAPNEKSKLRVLTVATTAGTWAVENNAAVNVSQAVYFGGGSMAGATGCSFVETTSATETNFVALANTATGCGAWSGTNSNVTFSTNDYRPTLANPGTGTYQIHVKGPIYSNSSNVCNFRLSDGTNTYEPQSSLGGGTGISDMFTPNLNWTVPVTAAGSKTLSIQASASGAATCGILTATSGRSLSWQIYYFPSQAQSVVRMDQTDYGPRQYTPTFTGFGTVTGINCTETRNGGYLLIDCKFIPGTPTAVEARVSLPTGLVASSTLPTISNVGEYALSSTSVTGVKPILIEPSVGYVTFGFNNGAGADLTKVNGSAIFGSGNAVTFQAKMQIQGWSANQSAPLISGGVTSSSAGMERIERASITPTSGAACTIGSQSGSWLGATTPTATGNCTVAITSGLFSAVPTCSCASQGAGGLTRLYSCRVHSVTTTAMTIMHNFVDNGSTTVTGDAGSVAVTCIGPR